MTCSSPPTFAFSHEIEHVSHAYRLLEFVEFFLLLCLLNFYFVIWRHCIYQRTEPFDLASLSFNLSCLDYFIVFFFFYTSAFM